MTLLPVIALASSTALAAETVQDRLDAHDAFWSAPFSLTARVSFPAVAWDPGQGTETWALRATSDGTTLSMWADVSYSSPATWRPPGTEGYMAADHDTEGRLVIWRRQAVVSQVHWKDRATTIVTTQRPVYLTAADRTTGETRRSSRTVPLRQEGVWLALQLALGRGLSIDRFVAAEPPARRAQGSFGSVSGTWELHLDDDLGLLLRQGRFEMEGSDDPLLEVKTTGSTTAGEGKGKAVIAREGTVTHHLRRGDWTLSVSDVELTLEADPALASTVAEHLAG